MMMKSESLIEGCAELVSTSLSRLEIESERINLELLNNGYSYLVIPQIAHIIESASRELEERWDKITYKCDPIKNGVVDETFKKNAIGAENGVGDPYAQFLISAYCAANDNFLRNVNVLFNLLLAARNKLQKMPINYGESPEDPFWNAKRVHLYPAGGGFMSKHRDTHFPAALKKNGIEFLQATISLSRYGTDFKSGGLFIESDGEKKYPERDGPREKIIFFDGSVMHGVDTVDSGAMLELNQFKGRSALFVNLYERIN